MGGDRAGRHFRGKRDPLKQWVSRVSVPRTFRRSPKLGGNNSSWGFIGESKLERGEGRKCAVLLGNEYQGRATVPLLEPSKWTTTEKNSREAMTFPLRAHDYLVRRIAQK
jgi:hypothetical protein